MKEWSSYTSALCAGLGKETREVLILFKGGIMKCCLTLRIFYDLIGDAPHVSLLCVPHQHPTGSPQPVVQEWTADRTCLADVLCKDCNTRAKTGRGSTQSAAGSVTFGPFPGLLPPHCCTSGTETSSSVRVRHTDISIMQCHVVLDSYLTCHALFVRSISSTTLMLSDELWLSKGVG